MQCMRSGAPKVKRGTWQEGGVFTRGVWRLGCLIARLLGCKFLLVSLHAPINTCLFYCFSTWYLPARMLQASY